MYSTDTPNQNTYRAFQMKKKGEAISQATACVWDPQLMTKERGKKSHNLRVEPSRAFPGNSLTIIEGGKLSQREWWEPLVPSRLFRIGKFYDTDTLLFCFIF